MKNNNQITVVIPAYNEEKTIAGVIKSVKPYCNRVLVVISKKSSDRTSQIVKRMKIEYIVDNGVGKGEGLRCAIDAVKHGIIVFFDADGSHIAADIPLVVKPILQNKADLVIASRFLGGSEEFHGDLNKFLRISFGMIISLIVNWRFKSMIMDTQNGFRAIRANVVKSLRLNSNHTEIETEMCIKCLKKNYRILEVPSRELKRKFGESNIVLLRDGWRYAWVTFRNLF